MGAGKLEAVAYPISLKTAWSPSLHLSHVIIFVIFRGLSEDPLWASGPFTKQKGSRVFLVLINSSAFGERKKKKKKKTETRAGHYSLS
jgi:hypothetical protein